MENLKILTNKIKKFYALVESHEKQIQDWIKETKKPIHSITNQSLVFRAVVPEDSVQSTPFEKFEGFRESLIETILASLEEEVFYLKDIRDKIDYANGILRKEQKSIEVLYQDLKAKNLLNLSELNPCCPRLEHIVDWCYDTWCYYHYYYLQIAQALINLNFENEETITALLQSFKEDAKLKKNLHKIRSFNFSEFDFII